MSTTRKREANRLNAGRSTGPKSKQGRSHSARNARRHGLSVPIFFDRTLSDEIKVLARKIAGDTADIAYIDQAYRFAQAQTDLNRIRKHKHAIVVRILSALVARNSGQLQQALDQLRRADRYERRARSQRKRAVRELSQTRPLNRSLEIEPGDAPGGA